MFGYIRAATQELKVREYAKYRSFYCGLCQDLAVRYGFAGRMTLTYDMTFLVILLSSLYGMRSRTEHRICPVHPLHRTALLHTKATDYAAAMSILLASRHLEDDWQDEKKVSAKAGGILLSSAVKKARRQYPDKDKAFAESLDRLSEYERAQETSLDAAAGCFGDFMAELFAIRKDRWEPYLRELGSHLGRFIYILDAWDDYEKDMKSGSYNVFRQFADETERKSLAQMLLTHEMGECTRVFEFLPIQTDEEILRNILYAGVWTRFNEVRKDEKKREEQNIQQNEQQERKPQ